MSAEAPGARPSAIPVADRQRWIDDYLRGRLDAADREHFEIALLADESLRDEVEADWLLRRTAREALDAARAPTAGDSALAPRGRPPRGRRALDWRLAAAFVLGIGVSTLGTRLVPDTAPVQPPRLAEVAIVDVPEWRSAIVEAIAELHLAPGQHLIRLAAPIDPGPYRMHLRDANNLAIARDVDVSASDSGEFVISVRINADDVGPLRLDIERIAPPGTSVVRSLLLVPERPAGT